MKNIDLKVFLMLSIVWVIFVTFAFFAEERTPIKQEYIIELIDQTNVKIYSHSTKLTYICTQEEIQETLLKDNL